jgi:mono/diheme cytochrome c family protein
LQARIKYRGEVLRLKIGASYGKIRCFQNSLINGVIRMTGLSKGTSSWLTRGSAIFAVLMVFAFTGGRVVAQDDYKPWVAPDAAKAVKNPVPATPESLEAGKQTFTDNCVLCHGDKGKGDGLAARASKIPPANFTDPKLMASETDGSLFWKMSEGRGPMPTWKDTLSEKERWQLVDYIRKLNKDANPK